MREHDAMMEPTAAGAGQRRPVVPLTMGSPSYRCVDLGAAGIRVTEALFPAGAVLAAHAHERTVVAVMLEGGFDLSFRSTAYDCSAGTVFVEPAGERHANRLGDHGARPIVLELARETEEAERRASARLLSEPRAQRLPGAVPVARRLQRELGRSDATSLLAIESLALELLAEVTERAERDGDARGRGGWVGTVRELLHANLHGPLRVADLARDLGVHRVHLGRVFRARYGESVGDYHRRIRIEWAARQLAGTDAPVADVALQAGFADQSHFTRFFHRVMGVTPYAYRGQRRPRSGR